MSLYDSHKPRGRLEGVEDDLPELMVSIRPDEKKRFVVVHVKSGSILDRCETEREALGRVVELNAKHRR